MLGNKFDDRTEFIISTDQLRNRLRYVGERQAVVASPREQLSAYRLITNRR
jgi:hypothetical protein